MGAVLALGLTLLACNATTPSAPTNGAGNVLLPTIDAQACAGVGTEAVLAGDANDPRVAWLLESGARVDVVFPPGFSARFTPALEVLNASGAVVARAGDRIDGYCVTAGAPLVLFP
jgi:hypothetical protein